MLFRPPGFRSSPVAALYGAAAGFVFTDDFNRANQNLEASPNWTRVGGVAGAAAIVSNELHGISATETLYTCPDIGTTNHYAQAEWTRAAALVSFVAVRAVDTNNFVGVRYSSGGLQIFKKVGGTFTQLGSTYTFSVVGTDVLRIEASGGDVRGLVNGVERIAPVSLGGDLSSSTLCGWVNRASSGLAIDDFQAGSL